MPNGSGFKWACFISYRHGQGELLSLFIDQLVEALENRLGIWGIGQKVFVDKNRLEPSYSVNPGLAEAICRSICMIVIYNLNYFDKSSPFCAKEFCTMIELEKKRLKRNKFHPKVNLIIPLLLRTSEKVPKEIFNRNPVDFTDVFSNPEKDLRNYPRRKTLQHNMLEEIHGRDLDKIAEIIANLYQGLSNLGDGIFKGCEEAIFPNEEKVNLLLEEASPNILFPFRNH